MQGDSARRLAAILAADIAGYSRLMGADEKGTHFRVRQILFEFVAPAIAEHRGRLVKTTGDGFLAMFDSPVEAVRCAIVIQQSMVSRNLELPRSHWIQFRIGVNLGDVIVEKEDIYGEGVNVAARLEQIAEPGGVYISGGIYEQIKYKLVCGYQSLGDRKVKNITDPVPIYRVLPDPAAVERARRWQTWRSGALFASVLLVTAAGGAWYLWRLAAREAVLTASPPPVSRSAPGPTLALKPEPVPPVQVPSAPSHPPEGGPTSAPAPPKSPGPTETTAEQSKSNSNPTPAPGDAPVQKPDTQTALLSPPPQTGSAQARLKEPEMVFLEGGNFEMGSNDDPTEKPVHTAHMRSFWISKYPVTVREWRACVAENVCKYSPKYSPTGDDDRPVSNMSWDDTRDYLSWLSHSTGKEYRLPTEAEWEYAARAGTRTKYWWGNQIGMAKADCKTCGGPYDAQQPLKVGTFPANPFSLHDMGGGVAQWVSDCWHKDYHGAPSDGSSWDSPNCHDYVLRGGSWRDSPSVLRVSDREFYEADVRYPTHGFRVARSE